MDPMGKGIFWIYVCSYIYHTNQPNVGKYTIHGSLVEMFEDISWDAFKGSESLVLDVFTLEVQPATIFYIGLFYSKGLSLSKRNHYFFWMVVDF